MIINENHDSSIIIEKDKYKEDFLNQVDINTFKQEEKIWIKKNLDFIYLNSTEDVVLKINPFCKFIEKKSINEDGEIINKIYIFLPKYLALGHLHIHIGEIDKADKIIKLMANYKHQFHLYEMVNILLSSCTPDKRELMKERIYTLIRKFLSYQYLIII